jgi:prophage regulatory protein
MTRKQVEQDAQAVPSRPPIDPALELVREPSSAPGAHNPAPANDKTLRIDLLPPEKLLTVEQVLTLIPLSKSAWMAGVRAGRYPQAVKLSQRSLFWRVADIRKFISKGQPA